MAGRYGILAYDKLEHHALLHGRRPASVQGEERRRGRRLRGDGAPPHQRRRGDHRRFRPAEPRRGQRRDRRLHQRRHLLDLVGQAGRTLQPLPRGADERAGRWQGRDQLDRAQFRGQQSRPAPQGHGLDGVHPSARRLVCGGDRRRHPRACRADVAAGRDGQVLGGRARLIPVGRVRLPHRALRRVRRGAGTTTGSTTSTRRRFAKRRKPGRLRRGRSAAAVRPRSDRTPGRPRPGDGTFAERGSRQAPWWMPRPSCAWST